MDIEDEKWGEVAIVEEGLYDVEVTHVEHDELPSTHHLYGKIVAGPLAGQKVKLGVLFIDKPDFFRQDPTHFDDDAVTALTGRVFRLKLLKADWPKGSGQICNQFKAGSVRDLAHQR